MKLVRSKDELDPLEKLALIDMSYSRINSYDMCNRMYFYQKILKYPDEFGAAATLGNVIHSVLEDHVGDTLVYDDMLESMLTHRESYDPDHLIDDDLMTAGEVMLADFVDTHKDETFDVIGKELPFEIVIGSGFVRGYIDLVLRDSNGRMTISDYKSGSWEVSPKDIPGNLQLGIYALAVNHLFPDEEEIYAELYYLRSGRRKGVLYNVKDDLPGIRNRVLEAINEMVGDFNFSATRSNIYVCRFCFTAETQFWTRNGLMSLGEAAGTKQEVISTTHYGADWIEADIRSFGEAKVVDVVLKRSGVKKVVRATLDHRWIVHEDNTKNPKSPTSIVETRDLKRNQKLKSQVSSRFGMGKVVPSPVGVMAGVVFGDGSDPGENRVGSCSLDLHGVKKALAPLFQGHPMSESAKVDKIQVYGLPLFMNKKPDLKESKSYLLGWLMGYVASDGSVSKSGKTVTVSSSRMENIDAVRNVAALMGIGTYSVVTVMRKGYNDYETPLHRLKLQSSKLYPEFFLNPRHRERFTPVPEKDEVIYWLVDEVIDRGETEEVFCATVPEYHNFVLDGFINVMNCSFRKSGDCNVGVRRFGRN